MMCVGFFESDSTPKTPAQTHWLTIKDALLVCLILATCFYSASAQPELEIRPREVDIIRPVDSNVVFTCSVLNVLPTSGIEIQWYDVHGRDIVDTAGQGRRMYVENDGASIKKLFIHVAQEHEGEYTCTASVDGIRQSKNVKLNLYKEITFDEAPDTQHPTQFTDALVKCQVSGQPLPSVTWRYRGSRIITGGRYTQDMYGLRIQNITTADDGTYNCRAEVDSDGRYDERPITVVVYTRPSHVEGAPRMFEGEAYQEFTITCQAAGFPAPKYQFYKDGNGSPIGKTERIQLDVVSGDLRFRPLNRDDAGRYRCVAYNDAGNVSTELNLRVVVPPNIRSLVNITSVEGASATLVCLSEGDPEPSMTFRKVGSQNKYRMGENENGRINMSYPEAGRLELKINNLAPNDMANYTCQSTNVAGNRELTGQLMVNFKPRFAPDHTTVVYAWAGKARNITCRVKAEPAPVFDWLKNDQPIEDNETYKIFKMAKETSLRVIFRETDQGWIFGTYVCRAKNGFGSAEQRIMLSRGMAPGAPRNLRALVISTTRVVLAVDEPLENGGAEILGYRINYDQNRGVEVQSGDHMQIKDLRPSTTYIFQVQARNEVNLGEPSTLLVTTGDVGPPSKIDLTCNPIGYSAYEYQVTWRKPETGGVPITIYEFRLRKLIGEPGPDGPVASEDWVKQQSSSDPDVPLTYYTLRSLEPETWYQLEVVAFNSIGWSPPNDLFIFQTRDGDSREESFPTPERVLPNRCARYCSWASLTSIVIAVLFAWILSKY